MATHDLEFELPGNERVMLTCPDPADQKLLVEWLRWLAEDAEHVVEFVEILRAGLEQGEAERLRELH